VTSTHRARAWALVGLAVVAAVAAAVGARAVLAVPSGNHVPGAALARRALAPDDVRAERAAEARFAALASPTARPSALRPRTELEDELSRIAAGGGRPVLRSRAATLLALLALADARSDPQSGARYAANARDALAAAVRLDAGNGAAAYDLELLLRSKSRAGARTRGGKGNPSASRQAGSQAPGNGY